MTDEITPADRTFDHLSRRGLLAAFGAAAATGAAIALPGTVSASSFPITEVNHLPATLTANKAGLAYLSIDGFQFLPDEIYSSATIFRTDKDGVGLSVAGELQASLPLPIGSTVSQVKVAYRGNPVINLYRRDFTQTNGLTPAGPKMSQFITVTLDNAPAFGTQTFDLSTPIPIVADSSYTLRFYVSPGSSLFGVTIGYLPPTQSFVPFSGSNPRAYDSRVTGGKLAPGEDRLVSLGSVGARSTVFNLAVTETEGSATSGGFVGAYSASLGTWPGNSSINWLDAGLNLSNTVICAVDPTGQIKLHGGANKTHVVLDVIGYLV